MTHSQTTINQASTIAPAAISGLTQVTAVAADHLLLFDATDSTLKKALFSDALETATSISNSADATAITIDSSERVGINTTSPNANLHVGSSSATGDASNPAIQIGGSSTYRLGMYTTTEGAVIDNANGDDGIIFHVKTAGEAMRIDAAGTIFQGTTSPTLHSAVRGIVFENGSIINDVTRGAGKSMTLAQNAAVDSGNTWAYLATDEASYYQQFNGCLLYTSPSPRDS